MSENIITENNALTAREIFERISELQKQITENSYYSLHRLGDTFSSIYDHEGVTAASEEIEEVCSVFKEREKTLMKMLEMYEKMYDNLCTTTPESKSIELIKLSVSAEIELIKSIESSSDQKLKMEKDAIEKGRTRMIDVILRSQDYSKQRNFDETENIPKKSEVLKTRNSEALQSTDK